MLGIARTIDLTLTGRMMDADECFRIGLINRIVPKEKVMILQLNPTLAAVSVVVFIVVTAMLLVAERFRSSSRLD